MAQSLLIMLPALMLAIAMLIRPYLGECAITRLRARRARVRRPRLAGLTVVTPLRARTYLLRGGCLIALALAGRAPPLALAGCR